MISTNIGKWRCAHDLDARLHRVKHGCAQLPMWSLKGQEKLSQLRGNLVEDADTSHDLTRFGADWHNTKDQGAKRLAKAHFLLFPRKRQIMCGNSWMVRVGGIEYIANRLASF